MPIARSVRSLVLTSALVGLAVAILVTLAGIVLGGVGGRRSLLLYAVVVATWWLSFEFVTNARHFNETGYQNAAMARGAYQVLAMLAPFLSDEGRVLFQRLAREYLSA